MRANICKFLPIPYTKFSGVSCVSFHVGKGFSSSCKLGSCHGRQFTCNWFQTRMKKKKGTYFRVLLMHKLACEILRADKCKFLPIPYTEVSGMCCESFAYRQRVFLILQVRVTRQFSGNWFQTRRNKKIILQGSPDVQASVG